MSLDRAELQDSARRMFGEAGLAPDRKQIWSLISEMGWLGLAAPEELGGLGQGRDALGVLYLELGRVLAPGPVIPALLAVDAVSRGDLLANRAAWIERLVGGEVVTASLKGGALEITVADAGGYTVGGMLSAVPDADEASHIVAWSDDGDLCALVPLQQPGVVVTPRAVWDQSRRLFDVSFRGAKLSADTVLTRGDAAADLVRDLQAHLLLALAADCVGGASAALEMTVEYLQTRKQFGRPLAMFQALKHRCADLKTMISAAEALFWAVAEERTTGAQHPVLEAAGLKSYAASVFHAVAEEVIQLHGGIGLTAEHPCHLFLKRALLNEALTGGGDAWDAAVGADALDRLGRAA
ncbi:acyl-CoA/acyl-ACP dehydrogenase [Phenylobacterium sp. LjRoot219]|uniref:acyl-CoA dehydrogenase family protein n=1 Tax=Phenylobacterium sp. LjRoot219 TaxID=3342283 RepID=UPI003ECC8F11